MVCGAKGVNELLCKICMVQIQPRKHVVDHADYTAPTRQHELDRTDNTDQEFVYPERSRLSSRNRWFVLRTKISYVGLAMHPTLYYMCRAAFLRCCRNNIAIVRGDVAVMLYRDAVAVMLWRCCQGDAAILLLLPRCRRDDTSRCMQLWVLLTGPCTRSW